ncbi:hypothetical protein EON66_01865, partial [archaeon]
MRGILTMPTLVGSEALPDGSWRTWMVDTLRGRVNVDGVGTGVVYVGGATDLFVHTSAATPPPLLSHDGDVPGANEACVRGDSCAHAPPRSICDRERLGAGDAPAAAALASSSHITLLTASQCGDIQTPWRVAATGAQALAISDGPLSSCLVAVSLREAVAVFTADTGAPVAVCAFVPHKPVCIEFVHIPANARDIAHDVLVLVTDEARVAVWDARDWRRLNDSFAPVTHAHVTAGCVCRLPTPASNAQPEICCDQLRVALATVHGWLLVLNCPLDGAPLTHAARLRFALPSGAAGSGASTEHTRGVTATVGAMHVTQRARFLSPGTLLCVSCAAVTVWHIATHTATARSWESLLPSHSVPALSAESRVASISVLACTVLGVSSADTCDARACLLPPATLTLALAPPSTQVAEIEGTHMPRPLPTCTRARVHAMSVFSGAGCVIDLAVEVTGAGEEEACAHLDACSSDAKEEEDSFESSEVSTRTSATDVPTCALSTPEFESGAEVESPYAEEEWEADEKEGEEENEADFLDEPTETVQLGHANGEHPVSDSLTVGMPSHDAEDAAGSAAAALALRPCAWGITPRLDSYPVADDAAHSVVPSALMLDEQADWVVRVAAPLAGVAEDSLCAALPPPLPAAASTVRMTSLESMRRVTGTSSASVLQRGKGDKPVTFHAKISSSGYGAATAAALTARGSLHKSRGASSTRAAASHPSIVNASAREPCTRLPTRAAQAFPCQFYDSFFPTVAGFHPPPMPPSSRILQSRSTCYFPCGPISSVSFSACGGFMGVASHDGSAFTAQLRHKMLPTKVAVNPSSVVRHTSGVPRLTGMCWSHALYEQQAMKMRSGVDTGPRTAAGALASAQAAGIAVSKRRLAPGRAPASPAVRPTADNYPLMLTYGGYSRIAMHVAAYAAGAPPLLVFATAGSGNMYVPPAAPTAMGTGSTSSTLNGSSGGAGAASYAPGSATGTPLPSMTCANFLYQDRLVLGAGGTTVYAFTYTLDRPDTCGMDDA